MLKSQALLIARLADEAFVVRRRGVEGLPTVVVGDPKTTESSYDA